MCCVYQDLSLFPNLSVAENLALNHQLEHRAWLVRRRRMGQIARQAMDRLGTTLPLEASAGRLPVAQKQLVAIARALVQDARLIVLDEPTTALTHLEVDSLFHILKNLRARGVAILFVSHQLREMRRIGDHYTILRGGQVVAEGPAARFDPARIVQCMAGRTLVADQPVFTRGSGHRMLLEVKQLTNNALHGVSLSLSAGQRVGLTGLLGSGQTALALALFGLEPYHSGQIIWQGRSLSIRNVGDALGAGIAYVPEDRLIEGLFLDQSIERNCFNLPALIVTLGTASLIRGGLLAFIGTRILTNLPPSMIAFSKATLFPIQGARGPSTGLALSVVLFFVPALMTHLLLTHTMLGRGIFALGGAPESARRVGFNIAAIQFFIYSFVGLLSGVAGILHAATVRNANPFDLAGLELTVIAAVVLGGTSITGGRGSVLGAVLGVALLVVLGNSLILLGLPTQWHLVATGLALLLGTGLTARRGRDALYES